MLFFFPHRRVPGPYGQSPFRSILLLSGLLCLLFGLAIITAPELLAYVVASFFILAGLSLVSMWWSMFR